MRLRIQNFAKVKEADIILDGITIIAGKNDTGKSTIGKVLDSMYNSVNNLGAKMKNAKKLRLQNTVSQLMNYTEFSVHISFAMITEVVERVLEAKDTDSEKRVLEVFLDSIPNKQSRIERSMLIKELFDKIAEIKAIPDEVFTKVIISKYFNEIFNGNINNTEHSDTVAEIEIEIKAGKNSIQFQNDTCVDFHFEYNPVSSSFYLDNPMLIDKLNDTDVIRISGKYPSEQEYHLFNSLMGIEISMEERAINEIINQERLDEVFGLLDRVIPGEITYNQKYEYKTQKGKKGIDIRSMSTGLKSFAIIKRLIMNGSLNAKDAIVLDEPEIHLHPEWQMVYAELIVALQEKFDLNFIINTHSSHFLETLDFYAEKYGRKGICHYYLSKESEGVCSFEEVTDTPEKIYKQLVDPSLLLAKEKEMWEEEHEPI